MNGFCNDFYSAHFMEGSSTSCTREINFGTDSKDCDVLLNVNEWTTKVNVLAGRSAGSNKLDITIGSAFTYDAATGVYTEAATAPASASSGTSCNNALKEISYNVYLTAKAADDISKTPYYVIDSITADVVVQTSVAAYTANLGVITQNYQVNFLT